MTVALSDEVVPGLRLDEAGFGGVDIDGALAVLRREAPVSWYERGRFWAISRYQDVQAISQNPQAFCSGRGVMMGDQLDETRLNRGGSIADGSEHLLETDPPRHRHLRRLVGAAFTPQTVSRLEPRIRELVVDALTAFETEEPVDLVDALAAPVPILVIAEMLGVPQADWHAFRQWTTAMVELLQPDVSPERAAAAGTEVAKLNEYLAALLGERAEAPGPDLISRLQQAQVDGESLSPLSVHSMCVAFVIAGNETTRSVIGGGARLLAEHPDQRRRLVDDPSLIPGAVEELLRWVSPVTSFLRTATGETTVNGQAISAGDCVALFYRSANRDESIWAEADTFDALRVPDPAHLAFGWGEHLCVGAPLARLELRVVFEELLKRYPAYSIAGEVEELVSPLNSQTIRLPVHTR